jgi:hypothetical protein
MHDFEAELRGKLKEDLEEPHSIPLSYFIKEILGEG